MTGAQGTFWEQVYGLRERGVIPRDWGRGHLSEHLQKPVGRFAYRTISTLPSNYQISRDGDGMGTAVRNGSAPRVWRVGRGRFRLIEDPDDDPATQEAEMTMAMNRAEDLRSKKVQGGGYRTEYYRSGDPPGRLGPDTEQVTGHHDMYPSIPVTLTSYERQALSGRVAEQKAMYIVNKHLKDKYGNQVEIEEDQDGADLRVSAHGKTERIEVKGTESPTLAWPELEVSGQESRDALEKGDASMYRVVDVSGANPRIYVLTHGQHFTLEPELKWAVKRVPLGDDRYPLRGQPYRYDRPYDPVAVDEWEALG